MTKKSYEYKDFIHKRTLIYGGIGVGKTYITSEILLNGIKEGFIDGMRLLDFAPKSFKIGELIIGGRIQDIINIPTELKIFNSEGIQGPRYTSSNALEVWQKAWYNYLSCKKNYR